MKTLFLIISLFTFQNVWATFSEDLKTLGLSSLYGTIGGTLIGVAAMAIGGNKKYVAQGASIGLVSGMGIGGYFVVKDNFFKKMPSGEQYPSDGHSTIYDSARVNDYEEIYPQKWQVVGDFGSDPLDYKFDRQLNNIQTKNGLTVYFNLIQKNF